MHRKIRFTHVAYGLVFILLTTVQCEEPGNIAPKKEINRFVFEAAKNNELYSNVVASITDSLITAHLPPDIDITSLTPTVIIPDNMTLIPASGIAQDFTEPVRYTVQAVDSTVQHYMVRAVVGKSRKADILSFTATINGQPIEGIINDNTILLPTSFIEAISEATITALQLSPHALAEVQVGDVIALKDGFSEIAVTAEDGATVKKYTVVALNAATQITSFRFEQNINPQAYTSLHDQDTVLNGIIDYRTRKIAISISPYIYGFNPNALIATFDVASKAVVEVGNVAQQSGITSNNFSNEVVYSIMGDDGSQTQYTVVISIIPYAVIPDQAFQEYLISEIPTAFDDQGRLDVNHADVRTSTLLDVGNKNISSLQGVEFFIALKELYCYSNRLSRLNMTKNKGLEILSCYSNQLDSLIINENGALVELWCYNNQLSTLSLHPEAALTALSCYNNKLTRLELTGSVMMDVLSCSDNELLHVGMSRVVQVQSFFLGAGKTQNDVLKNPLTTLDVSTTMKDHSEVKEAKTNLTQKIVIAVYDDSGTVTCSDYNPNTGICNY